MALALQLKSFVWRTGTKVSGSAWMLIALSSVELREARPCSVFTTSSNIEVKSSSELPVSKNVLCPSVEVMLSCMAISLFKVVWFADCKGAASSLGLHNNVFLRVGNIVFRCLS